MTIVLDDSEKNSALISRRFILEQPRNDDQHPVFARQTGIENTLPLDRAEM